MYYKCNQIDAICLVCYNKITRSVWKGKCFEFLQVNDLIIWFWKKYFSSIGWSLNLHLIIGKWSLIMPCYVPIQVFYTYSLFKEDNKKRIISMNYILSCILCSTMLYCERRSIIISGYTFIWKNLEIDTMMNDIFL